MSDQENLPPENIPNVNDTPSQKEIIGSSEPKIENMEVHHPSHAHGKINWRTYVWEFLMLFLAVFSGFLAEYQLEHKVERNREKQYIESMVQDINEDNEKMRIEIDRNNKKITGIDSLLNNIYATPYSDSSLKIMYHLNDYLHFRAEVLFTKRTITQLKNSGGLRLIRNMAASDSIVIYDEYCERIEKQFNVSYSGQLKARDLEFKIYDPRCSLKTNTKFYLLNNDEKLMMEYTNWVTVTKWSYTNYVFELKRHRERGKRIMQFLQNEYHLEK